MKVFNILFFVIIFVTYSLLNIFFIYKTRSTILLGKSTTIFYVLIFFLFITPFLSILFYKINLYYISRILTFISHSYLIFLFLFLFLNTLFSVVNTFIKKDNYIIYFLSLSIPILSIIYGYFETKNIEVKRINIKTNKIKNKIRILHISDTHFSIIRGKELATRIREYYKEIKPDILFFTGDLIDNDTDEIEEIIKILKDINPPLGKYSVLGNHEYYYGLEKSIKIHSNAGFKLLADESTTIGDIRIIGINDKKIKEIETKNEEKYTIVLKHRPYIENINFDLQLSGHTHGGQVFPFIILVSLYYKYPAGLYNIKKDRFIYVSKGTGSWGPIRILAKPEITLIEIEHNL